MILSAHPKTLYPSGIVVVSPSCTDTAPAQAHQALWRPCRRAEALLASLGCGNPTSLAQLHEGETVLDLGSGGGIDVLLSAKRAGVSGKVFGLDMTDEMLALANENKLKAGVDKVESSQGRDRTHSAPG